MLIVNFRSRWRILGIWRNNVFCVLCFSVSYLHVTVINWQCNTKNIKRYVWEIVRVLWWIVYIPKAVNDILYHFLFMIQSGGKRTCKSRHVTDETRRDLALPGTNKRNNMALSIVNWAKYVEGHTKLTRKSEASVESGQVLRFVIDDMRVINANVQASMKNTSCRWVLQHQDCYLYDSVVTFKN